MVLGHQQSACQCPLVKLGNPQLKWCFLPGGQGTPQPTFRSCAFCGSELCSYESGVCLGLVGRGLGNKLKIGYIYLS
jgi:hypothetical protein